MNLNSSRVAYRLKLAVLTASFLPAGVAPVMAMVAAAGLPIAVMSVTVSAARPEAPPQETLPIKKITLYRSGVGSFQRGGQVSGDSVVNLKFNTEQINDILKSMVVLDMSGGRVESIAYGSKDPLSKRLSSFGVDISDNPSLAELMKRLRGSAVSVTTPEGPISGTVLGVEMRKRAEGDSAQQPVESSYLTLVTPSGLRAVDIANVSSLDIQDKQLATDLNKALAALAEQRADRVKTVDISLRGDGTREIAIAYIHETPVWKTSYRLVLPESDGAVTSSVEAPKPDGRKPAATGPVGKSSMLQGWAIVENTTDEDWKDVRLSLVSGQPVSFQMDLYEPLYSYRPQIPVPTIPGVAPRIFEGGVALDGIFEQDEGRRGGGESRDKAKSIMDQAEARADMGRLRKEAAGRMPAPGAAPVTAAMEKPGMMGLEFTRAQAAAQGGDAGEMFQYQLNQPVTVQRQQSAMLPIISQDIQARRVSIYARGDNAKHPARGVELTNSTDLQLLPGPITVFDAGSYAGDAQIGHITPGDHRLLAYAVDLDVDAMVEDQSNSTVNKVRIVNGMLEQTVKQVMSTTYSFTSKDGKRARTLVVEHPRMMGWELVDAKTKPSEKTETLYRFQVGLDAAKDGPGKPVPMTIAQERTDRQFIGLVDYDFNTLMSYSKEGKVSPKVMDAFKDAVARKRAVDDARQKVQNLEQEKAEIDKDQSRIRENMKSVDKQSQIYARYMQKLDTQETRVEGLAKEIEAARANAQKLEGEFNTFIANLNVE